MKPVVAFLTPHFNRHDLFPATLDSMKSQTLANWECWLVDDGSNSESWEHLRKQCEGEPRIRLLKRSREPKGACTCRNIGAVATEAKYVISLDTDDILEPFCLEQRVREMDNNPSLDFGIFPSLMFEKVPHDLGLWWNIDTGENLLERQFKQDAICQGTGSIWRRDSFRKIEMWNETLALWQDIDLYFRAFIQDYKYATFFHLPADLHNRCNHASLSRHAFFERSKQESRVRVLKSAVMLLEKTKKFQQLPNARFMLAEIVEGNARARNFDIVDDLIRFGHDHHVTTRTETRRLRLVRNLYRLRLYRVPGTALLLSRILNRFSCQSLLGRVRVGQESQHLRKGVKN